MGKKKRDNGLNMPFRDLKLPSPPPAPPAAPRSAAPAPPEDDSKLFLQAMSGTTRLDKQARVEPSKREQREGPSDDDLALAELHSLTRGEGQFSLTESEELISGSAPGVNKTLLDSLIRGDFAFRRHLDLHGLSRDAAKETLVSFVREARKDGERCVLVITGRGKSSPLGVSVLKESLPRWLSRKPLSANVLAFCTAQAVHGGPGAFYVLLRRPGVRPFGVDA